MKKILFLIISLLSPISLAEDKVPELPPLDPIYMGEQSMVLISHGSRIYASHLASYKKPNDFQLIYQLENKSVAVLQTVRDNQLVTIKAKPFNIQRLMRGEKVVIQADLYAGHFDRDGMKVYENISLAFDKQLYFRTFDDIKPSSTRQEYDVVSLKDNYTFYIHKIQTAPSFSHILGVDLQSSCLSSFSTSTAVPKETELQYKFINCGTIKPLNFETEDFQ